MAVPKKKRSKKINKSRRSLFISNFRNKIQNKFTVSSFYKKSLLIYNESIKVYIIK